MTAGLLELIDGYSAFGGRYDLTDAASGESLKRRPPLEFHDQLEDFLRCGGTPPMSRPMKPPE